MSNLFLFFLFFSFSFSCFWVPNKDHRRIGAIKSLWIPYTIFFFIIIYVSGRQKSIGLIRFSSLVFQPSQHKPDLVKNVYKFKQAFGYRGWILFHSSQVRNVRHRLTLILTFVTFHTHLAMQMRLYWFHGLLSFNKMIAKLLWIPGRPFFWENVWQQISFSTGFFIYKENVGELCSTLIWQCVYVL